MSAAAAGIAHNLAAVRARLLQLCRSNGRDPDTVALLAVSKTQPAATVRAAHAAGQRRFGENRVQELVAKASELRELADLRWQLIGSLQTNKVKDLLAVPGLELLHSLDRAKLADELQKECARGGRSLDVLLQIDATGEASKHGVPPAAAAALLAHVRSRCPSLRVQGLMAMGPLAGDPAPVFAAVARLREHLRQVSGLPLPVLSLGMSGDLPQAIAAGSTLVRVGTAVFGTRG
ncbi:MAG TPA: YggS family pyridoxal phosphate-dependent enzyme [Planctomycetota bacterium]|nr:YggS family pyridoxal phosphate-dependent enzyme [Planctomycetota bacterium]